MIIFISNQFKNSYFTSESIYIDAESRIFDKTYYIWNQVELNGHSGIGLYARLQKIHQVKNC
jgi:glutathione peroxidase-family protein